MSRHKKLGAAVDRPALGGAHDARSTAEPLDLIHTNNSPKRALARVSGVSYSLEWGVSQAVVDAAFAIAVKLAKGGYAKST